MKIAIPVTNGKLSAHFGHCQAFAVIEADPATKSVGAIQSLTPPPHEPGVLPRWLASEGAEVIIAGGMGQRARQLFEMQGISVITGAPSESAKQIAIAFVDGSLETGENVCDH